MNILHEAYLTDDNPADSENLPEDPANTESSTNTGPTKKQRKRKGKSKNRSKSGRATSSTSETSPRHKDRKPQINESLAKQVAQDLHLFSDGSDSENPEETNKGTPAAGDSQPSVDMTWVETGAKPAGMPTPPKKITQNPSLGGTPDAETTVNPTPEEEVDAAQPPTQPTGPVPKPVTPDSTEGVAPQPAAIPPDSRADTKAPIPATTEVTAPPRFRQWPVALDPNVAPPVPPGVILDEGDLQAQVVDRSMADLAQSLAVTLAGGNPHTGSFSGVMARLKEACGLMTDGFQQACLDVEVVVWKMIEDATAHNRAFTTKAAQDLDLWTSALQPIFDTDRVTDADMEI